MGVLNSYLYYNLAISLSQEAFVQTRMPCRDLVAGRVGSNSDDGHADYRYSIRLILFLEKN